MTSINGIPVTDSQAAVFGVLEQFPKGLADHALVPLAQHQMGVHQSSSGIRTRRKELGDKKLVYAKATTTTGSGRSATVYAAIKAKKGR